MQRKRMRKTKLRGGLIVLLLLLTVLVADVTDGDRLIEQSPEETATQAPMETPSALSLPLPTNSPAEMPMPLTETETEPVMNDHYAALSLTQEDIEMLAAIVFLEAGNQSAEGQQAVVEVVLNRVLEDNFPDMVQKVIFQGVGTDQQQFTPAGQVSTVAPNAEQYEAVNAALYGESILPKDVVYFSTTGENSRVWGTIGAHVFCYQYIWG